MAKTVIIVSSYIDSTIREYQVDVTFHIFKTLDELDSYVESSPLRASEIFLTKEVFPNVNTSLNYFTQMLENPFLRVDKVTYITEVDSPEIASISYIIEQKGYTNWEVIEGHLTREYVSGIINGNLRNEVLNPKRKSVYRMPKETYLREKMKERTSLEEEYEDDEQNLANIPRVEIPTESYSDSESICDIYKIVGGKNAERTMFAFLVAQYLSFSGKTLILESDVEYHRLTEYVTKANLSTVMLVEVSELLTNPVQTIARIRASTSKLIVVGAIDKVDYKYNFVLNILYNNLMSNIRYIVQELDFSEAPTTEKFTAIFPATMIGILEMAQHIDVSTIRNATFVGMDLNNIQSLVVANSNQVSIILQDVLEIDKIDVQLIAVTSLKIGGDSLYDLRSIINN